jgi:hypothetical protein
VSDRTNKGPGIAGAFVYIDVGSASEHCDIFQQRDHAEDDHDDARDLLGATIDREQVDQIQNQNNDEKSNQRTDEHEKSPETA